MKLKDADNEQLGKWYVELNCYRWPDDLDIPDKPDLTAMHHSDAALVLEPYMMHIEKRLGAKGMSRAWWIYKLKRRERAWRKWWNGQTGGSK